MDVVNKLKKPLVSVIVPVYNVERYLERCLDSIVGQTYQNLEIVLVNDGSTDRSEEICLAYAQSDARICLINQKNQGPSAARNTGLDYIHGEYLTFVDSDDYLSLSFVELLLTRLLKDDVRLIVCDYDCPGEESAEVGTVYSGGPAPAHTLSRAGVFHAIRGHHENMRFTTVWGKLYCRTIFSSLRFDSGKLFEDALIAPKIYRQTDKICCVDLPLYHYVQSRDSILRENGVSAGAHPDLTAANLGWLEYFQAYGDRQFIRMSAGWVIDSAVNWCDILGPDSEERKAYLSAASREVLRITGKRVYTLRSVLYRISPRLYRRLRTHYHNRKAGDSGGS